MLGSYKIIVKNNRNRYTFELHRNITVLRGDSGRGKTTLYDMIREYNRFGKNSGVTISCDRDVIAIDGDDWEEDIKKHPGSIIVIDEDSGFIRSKDFARVVRGSDNYYLLITRNYLSELPISVEEIYELEGAKNKKFRKIYSEIQKMYDHPQKAYLPFVPEVIITEDSGSGFQFFFKVAEKYGILCVTAGSKTKVFNTLNQYSDKDVVIIADGAAFGPEMNDVVEQQKLRPRKVAIFLPESFEWIVLKSDAVLGVDNEMIEHPELYADSKKYMSWEQYYTDLLVKSTKDSGYMKYKKTKLSDYYLQDRIIDLIMSIAEGIRLKKKE